MISNFDMTLYTNSLKMLLNSSSLPIKCPGTRLQTVLVSNSEFLGDLTTISGFGNTTIGKLGNYSQKVIAGN